jgi:hypothetical protein
MSRFNYIRLYRLNPLYSEVLVRWGMVASRVCFEAEVAPSPPWSYPSTWQNLPSSTRRSVTYCTGGVISGIKFVKRHIKEDMLLTTIVKDRA